jgi:hypothetical protein
MIEGREVAGQLKTIKMQRRIYGVTEQYWARKDPEFKFYWGLVRQALAWCLGIFIITKTGNILADALVTLLAGGIPLLITAGQRDFSKYSRPLRRRITKYSVGITLTAVTALGMGVYLALMYGLFSGVVASLPDLVLSAASPSFQALASIPTAPEVAFFQKAHVVMICAMVIGSLAAASFNAFRGMQLEELIHWLPKRGLIKYLVRKELIATDITTFVGFELSVIMASVMFSSGVVMLFQIATMSPAGK